MAGRRARRIALLAALAIAMAAIATARAASPGWSDYQIIMWQPESAANYRRLEAMGITAAAMIADRDHPHQLLADRARPLIAAHMRWYVENAATDFYSAYHRYTPGHPVNWRFLATERLYRAQPGSLAALIRDPSLSDPVWLKKIATRLNAIVATNRPYHPLFYNLADESGIADLNAFWDFDFSKPSLVAMRQWLKTQYPSLAALNAEWGTQFRRWADVVPMTTPVAMRQRDGNFSAWSDFKAWMDVAFARAVATGRDAVHAADPAARAGLEGGQKLGWGGYNYATLAPAIDVMETEPELFPLVHSINPRLRLLSTSFVGGPIEEHRIWRALLNGGRGIIIWDARRQFIHLDGSLGARGRTMAPYLHTLRDGVGALIINSTKVPGKVAILYSPESLRVQWLLDWRGKGDAWLSRGADAEDHDNNVRNEIDAYAESLEELGFAPTYLTPAMVADGALQSGLRALVLPHAIALSAAAARAIDRFAAMGGMVIADTMPGIYDGHGKWLATSRLGSLFKDGKAVMLAPGAPRRIANADPPVAVDATARARLGAVLAAAGIEPAVRLADLDGASPAELERHAYRDGKVTIIALLRDAPAIATAPVTLRLRRAAYVYDVRAGAFLGRTRAPHVTPGKVAPVILALSPDPLPRPTLALQATAQAGESITIHLAFARPDDAAVHVIHLNVSDPTGREAATQSGNVIFRGAATSERLRFPRDAIPGTWAIAATDVMSGKTARASIVLAAMKGKT